jgi:hypothetical protein
MDIEKKTFFKERQRFTHPILFLSVAMILLTPLVVYFFSKDTKLFQENFLASILTSLVFFSVAYFVQLETKIDESGIHYRFIPFQRKFTSISKDEIQSVFVRTYKPIREYGGWGLRYSFRNGKAINVKGKEGIQLVLKNEKKILIGTQLSQQAKSAIDSFFSK